MRTFADMCALRGVKLAHDVGSWCGLTDDGTLAIFTLWQDCLVAVGGELRYPLTHQEDRATSENPQRHGWCEMVDVANHCLDNPSIRVLGVMCRAADIDADPCTRESTDEKEFKVLRVARGGDGEVWATVIGFERV